MPVMFSLRACSVSDLEYADWVGEERAARWIPLGRLVRRRDGAGAAWRMDVQVKHRTVADGMVVGAALQRERMAWRARAATGRCMAQSGYRESLEVIGDFFRFYVVYSNQLAVESPDKCVS